MVVRELKAMWWNTRNQKALDGRQPMIYQYREPTSQVEKKV